MGSPLRAVLEPFPSPGVVSRRRWIAVFPPLFCDTGTFQMSYFLSSLLGGAFLFSAMTCFVSGFDRGVSGMVSTPAVTDVADAAVVAADRPSFADRFAASSALVDDAHAPQRAKAAVRVASGISDRYPGRIYFDPNPLVNTTAPVFNVFRPGGGLPDVGGFTTAPDDHADEPAASESPVARDALPFGCEPMVSPFANRQAARVPINCLSSNERGDPERMLASLS